MLMIRIDLAMQRRILDAGADSVLTIVFAKPQPHDIVRHVSDGSSCIIGSNKKPCAMCEINLDKSYTREYSTRNAYFFSRIL